MTATILEAAVLNQIARSDYTYVNGSLPATFEDVGSVWFWADEMAANIGISEKAVGGVVTSLQAKGWVGVHIVTAQERRDGDHNGIWMTPAGFAAWQASN